ncbi:helix-turn-helix domain-containing protein [Paenibacillus abyssi]|nr:helix-turn-helix domain-containing protein [Paenibacillus abyssi]
MSHFPQYFKRLLLFSLIIGALPLIILGSYSYIKSSEIIREKVNESNMQILLQTQMRVEQVFETIDYSVTQFISSSILQAAMEQSISPEDFVMYRELGNSLRKLQLKKLGIDEIYLVNIDKDWIIRTESVEKYSNFKLHSLFQQYALLSSTSAWVNEENSPWIRLVKKLPILTFSTHPKGMIVLNINKNNINELLSQNQRLGDVLILDEKHRIVSGRYPSYADDDLLLTRIAEQLADSAADQGHFTMDINKMKAGITYRKSSYNNWTYISAVSINEITKESRAIGLVTVFSCIVIFGIVSIIAYLGANRIYYPIRKLYQSIQLSASAVSKDARKDGSSAKNCELSYIAERIQALVNNGTQLEHELQSQVKLMKELFVLKLFLGQITIKEAYGKIRYFGYPSTWKWLSVLTLQIDSLEGTKFRKQDKALLLFSINNIVNELIPSKERFSPILINNDQITLHVSSIEHEQEYKKYIEHLAETIRNSVFHYLKIKVSIGISRPFKDLEDIVNAYEESKDALKYRFRLGDSIILSIENITSQRPDPSYLSKHTIQELIESIRRMDRSKAEENVKQCFAETLKKKPNYHEYQFIIIHLLAKLLEIVQESGESVTSLFGEKSIVEQLLELNSNDDIEAFFKRSIVEPIIDFLEQRKESQNFNITEHIKEMIKHEFETDLSLESCAARMNFHPSYISRVFKKDMNLSFSDYLAQYRLEMTKKWLRETDMKVSEIAERLHYNSSASFIRYFRNMEGMTPGQYKKSHASIKG